jgi:hypothetical protein
MGRSEKPIENALILIEGDKIVSVTLAGNAPSGAKLIDLSKFTVLPGLTHRARPSIKRDAAIDVNGLPRDRARLIRA